jgi:hypothetical protein
MSFTRWRMAAALQICLLVTAGSVCATDSSNRTTRSAPLDLRVPPLDKVMTRGDLLAEMGSGDDPIEVVVEPPLLLMTSDADAPLGIVDSLRWSADHPAQAWRLLLPANNVHDPYN